jgi:polyribonucleotide nucleotidyltransferase
VHISKLGRGKRINNVEDVLTLGQELEVRVDDIDDKGKVSLTPVGDGPDVPASSGGNGGPASVSFEDAFDSEIAGQLGDLGPGGQAGGDDRGDRRGDDRRGGDRRGGGRDGGRDRGPRRHR